MNEQPNKSRQRQKRAPIRRPRISVTIDDDMADRIGKLAGKMSHSAFAAIALENYVMRAEEQGASYGSTKARESKRS